MSIEIKNLSKNYKDVAALDGVTLTFEGGKIYGLLGRNGAGKTTLIKSIGNYIFASDGEISVDGEAVGSDGAAGKVCAMLEDDYFPDKMKVGEAFGYAKEFFGNFDGEFALSLCKKFGLDPKKKVQTLSTGYRSVFKFIYALSTDAPYIFLDEPVLGLDANHRDLLYKVLIERYAEVGNTVVISTHLIGEAASLIEEVVILDKGKIIDAENKDALLSRGYSVSGVASKVDGFTAGKKVLGESAVGGLKTAYIMGEREALSQDGLEISALDLQQLFIQMTSDTQEK